MGNSSSRSSSSSAQCGLCSSSDRDLTRPTISPGCCTQSYHMDCVQTHLSTRNTTCPHCHHVFPANILDLHQATTTATTAATPTVIPHAQLIPQQQMQQPFNGALPPPPPAFISNNVQQYRRPSNNSRRELCKEMHGEELVPAWVPPPSTDSVDQPEVEVLVECSPELPQATLDAVTGFHSVVSVSASSQAIVSTDEDDTTPSPPMDIVCILDVSGSMSSDNKLNNLKCAVNFMRDELKDNDRMSVITFERSATRIHGLLKMTPANKSRTEAYINDLCPGGGTRILSGLQEAFQVLQSRQSRNPISSVFLLTDGIDASDLREKKKIAKEIKEMGASLFVYGFGNDHDSQHLKTIADAGEGTFAFIEKSDMVIDAFGGALGAEKSIFAQNLCLTLSAASGAVITNVHAGSYRKVIDPTGTSAKVYFPNLMQGEQRDVLLMMNLPSVAEPEDNHTIVTTALDYGRIEGGEKVDMIGQPSVISRVSKVDPNLERDNNVDVQVNRALLESSTAASLALADQGKYENARSNLDSTLNKIKSSSSCQRQDAKTVAFVSEIEATIGNLRDANVYRCGGGRSMMTEMASNINQQRCTYTKTGRSDAYQNCASLGLQAKTQSKKAKFFSK